MIAGGMAAIAVPLGALLAFLMVRTDVPGRNYLEPLILIPIFVSAVVIAFGYVVAIGPVGIFSTLAKDLHRLCAVEFLFAAGADRDRGTHPCPACLSCTVPLRCAD